VAKRFAPGFVATASDGAILHFTIQRKGTRWKVSYTPASQAVALATRRNEKFVAPINPVILIEGERNGMRVTLHPHNLDAASPNFLLPKYDKLATITLENFGFMFEANDLADIESFLADLPAGFVRDPYYGLGLTYDIRLIVETIEELGVTDLHIVKGAKGEPTIEEKSYLMPYALFDTVRRDIGRVHNKALGAARIEKAARLRDKLLTSIDAETYPLIGRPYRPGAVVQAVGDGLKHGLALSPLDADLLVEATAGMIREVGEREPAQLLKLTEAVETVTLEAMIAHVRARVAENHGEEDWQRFLNNNAFILRLAFGVPVLLFQGQATVGGRSYGGAGDKRSDFLMRAASTGNLSIVEIKTPQTDLLTKREYRGGIFAPSKELSGAVAQVLDQRWQLQRSNTQLANDHHRNIGSDIPDNGPPPETYAVQCVVIAGRTPRESNAQKSLELYRGSLTGVMVLTFDELLSKLITLRDLLKDPDATKLAVPTVTIRKPKRRRPGTGRMPRRS
jgi:Domain of unknown function (DUF4263)